MLRRMFLWLRAFLTRRRVDRDLDDELAFHLERETVELVAAGLEPQAARQQAALKFGPLATVTDQCRDAWGIRVADALSRDTVADVRSAGRQFARHPLATLTMIVVLALGIGFSAAIFVFVSSLTSGRPVGVSRDADLVRVRGLNIDRGAGRTVGREFTYEEYELYARQSDTFANVAAWTSVDAVLDVGVDSPNLQSGAVTFITPGYFTALGVRPVVGTGLPGQAGDHDAPVLAGVISDAIWDRYFARAPDIVGRTIDVNNTAITIAGVAPPGFVGARSGGTAIRVWVPLSARSIVQTTGRVRDDAVFGIVARLQPGVTVEQATVVTRTVATSFHTSTPTTHVPDSTDVVELLAGNYFPTSGETPGSAGWVAAMSLPLLVLLITCTNVSTLLTGLALSRRREIAVRLSLGARRARVVRQLLTETALLATAGGALGLYVVWTVLSVVDAGVLMAVPIVPDWRAAVFTFVVALGVAVVFGLSPALHATRVPLSSVMQESDVTVTRSRLQMGLVVAQIALTQPILISMGSALLELRDGLQAQPKTVAADRILEVRFNTNERYGAIDARREDSLRRVRTRLASLSGIEGVVQQGLGTDWSAFTVQPGGRATDGHQDVAVAAAADVDAAPPGYFTMLEMPIVRGRDFVEADAAAPGTVVVTSALAMRLWGLDNAIGQRLVPGDRHPRWPAAMTVVGVVGAADEAGARDERIYVPAVETTGHLLVRTSGPAAHMLPVIRAAALAEAPESPIVSTRTRADIETEERRSMVRGVTAAVGVGLLGLLLAAIGLYATVAVAVRQRVREIGVRTALGAPRTAIVQMFLVRGLWASAIGLVIGLSLSFVVLRVGGVRMMDGNESPSELVALAVLVAVFVLVVGVVAAWLPARRAARLDPLDALRLE
jgi:predicted permease